MLIAAGADLNWRDNSGFTPLMNAVAVANLDAVRALIEAGADVNAGSSRILALVPPTHEVSRNDPDSKELDGLSEQIKVILLRAGAR